MTSAFHLRAALCTVAVFFGVGVLATADLPSFGLPGGLAERAGSGRPTLTQPGTPAPAPAAARFGVGGAGGGTPADCGVAGTAVRDGTQFLPGCATRAASPDGSWVIVAAPDGVRLVGRDRQPRDDLTTRLAGLSFAAFWSPASDWFFVNEQGERARLRVFQVIGGQAVERSAVLAEAIRTAGLQAPCFAGAEIASSGWRWSNDGRRIVLNLSSRGPDCSTSLWLVGAAETGLIEAASIRGAQPGTSEPPVGSPFTVS